MRDLTPIFLIALEKEWRKRGKTQRELATA